MLSMNVLVSEKHIKIYQLPFKQYLHNTDVIVLYEYTQEMVKEKN